MSGIPKGSDAPKGPLTPKDSPAAERPPYRTLDAPSLIALLAGLNDLRTLLGSQPDDWRVSEVGDGNLNLVFIVDGPKGSV